MLEKFGIPTDEMVREKFPSEERIKRGRVAVVECYQRIPCNPCQTACAFGAICVGDDINNIPVVDFDKCTGCGACVAKCPGLAIMLVSGSSEEGTAQLSLPYEMLPLPKIGDTVTALDRCGNPVGAAVVTQVLSAKGYDRTHIVRIKIPYELIYTVRNFRVEA